MVLVMSVDTIFDKFLGSRGHPTLGEKRQAGDRSVAMESGDLTNAADDLIGLGPEVFHKRRG